MNKIKNFKYWDSIIMSIIGILLIVFNKVIYNLAFEILGTLMIINGVVKIIIYYLNKKEMNPNIIYSNILLIIMGLLVIIFGALLTKFLLFIFFFYLLFNSIVKLIVLINLIHLKKNYIYNLIILILQTILLVYLLLNINKSIEMFFILLGVYLIIIAISKIFKNKDKNETMIEAEIIEK